ncbi:MAG: amidase [Myxococcota bacterium]
MDELIFAGAGDLARAVRQRRVSSAELVEACLERIAQVNPVLRAVVELGADAARTEAVVADRLLAAGEAPGLLHGVPITLKDSLDTAGMVTTWGTPGRAGFVPERDATVVARLRAAGAIVLGKTNTPEFTMGFEADNPLHGRTANPFDKSRTSGGSSGGAAALVSAGAVPLEVGSDTGGSIRLPAHFCGCAGLRSTSGRVPRTGHAIPPGGMLDALTTLGPLARRVEDLEIALGLLAGPDGFDPFVVPVPLRDSRDVTLGTLRVAVHVDNGLRSPAPEIAAAVRLASSRLSDRGCRVAEVLPPGIEETGDLFRRLLLADGGAWLRRLLAGAGTDPDASSLGGMLGGPTLDGAELSRLVDRWDRFRARMLGFLGSWDAILCPVSAIPACPHGDTERDLEAFTYTMTWNLTGWPAAVVRVSGTPRGLPIGVQLVAAPWREDVALALAAVLEEDLGGWQRPPL